MRVRPKFHDCRTCKYFNQKVENPICGDCGAGEFYTERVNSARPSDNQLLRDYKEFFDE